MLSTISTISTGEAMSFSASADMNWLSKHRMAVRLNEWLEISNFQELRKADIFLDWPFIFNVVLWSIKVVS